LKSLFFDSEPTKSKKEVNHIIKANNKLKNPTPGTETNTSPIMKVIDDKNINSAQ
jgi:hypothetical protein